jgi:hypothetical protein
MGTTKVLLVLGVVIISTSCWAQESKTPSWLKTIGTTAVATGVQALNPQAQTVVDQAKALTGAPQQENFLITKAKGFMGSGNYETALQVASYVKTNINAKSLSADKIITDAKAALAKYAQDKVTQTTAPANQAKSEVVQTSSDVKNLLSPFNKKK